MSQSSVIGQALPNMPWEDRPPQTDQVVWRSQRNPIIPHDLIPSSNSIFNSAVVPYEKGFAGVFRCDDKARRMVLHAGRSRDGVSWEIDHERIEFVPDPSDPRVIWIEDRYYGVPCLRPGGRAHRLCQESLDDLIDGRQEELWPISRPAIWA